MRGAYPLPCLLAGALRAVIDLGAARIALTRIKPASVLARNRRSAVAARATPPSPDIVKKTSDDAAFFFDRMAQRVPWRADCLVQALAGQQWLARAGIASEIVVGTAKHDDGRFEAHAWLRQGNRIVLGGDVSDFQPLLDPDSELLTRK